MITLLYTSLHPCQRTKLEIFLISLALPCAHNDLLLTDLLIQLPVPLLAPNYLPQDVQIHLGIDVHLHCRSQLIICQLPFALNAAV